MENRYLYSDFLELQMADEDEELKAMIPKDAFIELNMFSEELIHQVKTYLYGHAFFISLQDLPKQQFYLNIIAEFLKDEFPKLDSFLDQDIRYLQQKFRKWMSSLRFDLIRKKFKNQYHENLKDIKPFITILELLCLYTEATHPRDEMKKDIWQLDRLPYPCRTSKIFNVQYLNFTKIRQQPFREQVKQVYRIWIRNYAISTLKMRISAINKFSHFMAENYQEVNDARQITREMIEQYLIYNKLVTKGKTSSKSNVATLKYLLEEIGKIHEDLRLQRIFINQDIPSVPKCKFEVYTEQELKLWIEMLKYMEEQHARALLLHILLGTRISEILLLPQDCISKREGCWWIKLTAQKGNDYCKPITEEIKTLIAEAIAYTRKAYQNEEYVFVDKNRPTEPMKYSSMRYHMTEIINKFDMRNEKGELFKPKTHIFRHCYGVKLTELHVDDITIAKLLGHANTDSVHYYRRMSYKIMADETREVRKKMDRILLDVCFANGMWDMEE